ncbi:NAD(P)H-hydrate dehydratase [Aromatoleum diolicum]|uniref:Bifunctional NAD(P)H-hydrate repair enzyme n=1 Tax=Aromatoleum diolicum TaxID=75796 RepID=A0ABX1QA80_9RHOO|nr:NAD(P)H-hydrate dehydratase [Aromatoleum diolicum]NMG74893.1 NAD(P)H-hydrate dehydratase [Aromatoleum diolicum]
MFPQAQPIYPVSGIRTIEARVGAQAQPTLMERAGRASAEEAVRLTQDRAGQVLIACGPGNNGGDGFVMARRLLQAGRPVTVAFADDPAKLPPDAAAALAAWRAAGGETVSDFPAAPANGWALVVDALFGIGLRRPVSGRYATWIDALNAQPAPRLAIDIPSGLDADTGRVLGTVFHATATLTFLALKPGLLTLDGPDIAGVVHLHRLDIDPAAWLAPMGMQIQPGLVRQLMKSRLQNTHKGCYGDVGIVGGARGMTGAALLAGRAALKLGTGRVLIGLVDDAGPAVDFNQAELMLQRPEDVLEQANVLALGPGLGRSTAAAALVEQAARSNKPIILDADALNLVAASEVLKSLIAAREAPTLMTPHPGEAGRLLGTDTANVQADRVASTLKIAGSYQALVVLKGSGSVVTYPDGRWLINSTGHPGMASAGMGDVLTGLIASLVAQGWPAESALLAAVHLHGAAADRLAREGIGPIGLTASEVAEASRGVFNGWIVQAGKGR